MKVCCHQQELWSKGALHKFRYSELIRLAIGSSIIRMHETHRKAIDAHILTDRTHKYRRALIGFALILIGWAIFQGDIEFEKLRYWFFKNDDDGKSNETGKLILHSILWLLLVYNTSMLFVSGRYDYRVWLTDALAQEQISATDRQGFPEPRMWFCNWRNTPLIGRLTLPRTLGTSQEGWPVDVYGNDTRWILQRARKEGNRAINGKYFRLRRSAVQCRCYAQNLETSGSLMWVYRVLQLA